MKRNSGKFPRGPSRPRYVVNENVGPYHVEACIGRREYPGKIGHVDVGWCYRVRCQRCDTVCELLQHQLRQLERAKKTRCTECPRDVSEARAKDRTDEAKIIARTNAAMREWATPRMRR